MGGGGPGGAFGGRGPGGSVGGGVSRWGVFGGTCPPRPSIRQSQAPLTSPCPPSSHTIIVNVALTFAASWFSHASHVDYAQLMAAFCHMHCTYTALQHSTTSTTHPLAPNFASRMARTSTWDAPQVVSL